jgi:hypothetical protein
VSGNGDVPWWISKTYCMAFLLVGFTVMSDRDDEM